MRMKFEKKSPTTHIAFIECEREAYGRKFRSRDAVRAIKERVGWRIDKTAAVAGAWLPWEPVDDKPRRTLKEAKDALRDYAKRCNARPPRGW